MLIGELSKRTGLSKDTIRFYEKKGLIELSKQHRRENNYKEYPEQVLNKLSLIITIKNLGFTLTEIETFFRLWHEEDAPCENLVYTLENKLKQVDGRIEMLTQLKSRLTDSLHKCQNDECEFEMTIPSSIC